MLANGNTSPGPAPARQWRIAVAGVLHEELRRRAAAVAHVHLDLLAVGNAPVQV